MEAMGHRLRQARERAGLTGIALDDRANVGRGTVSRIERGDSPFISLDVVAHVARAIGANLDWLVWGEGPEVAPKPGTRRR